MFDPFHEYRRTQILDKALLMIGFNPAFILESEITPIRLEAPNEILNWSCYSNSIFNKGNSYICRGLGTRLSEEII